MIPKPVSDDKGGRVSWSLYADWRYQVVAFAIGFVMMSYELVASRLLAPTVGSSIYVWTSVIGVIVAALSIGYALGGVIADKRVKNQDVVWLLLACVAGVIATLLASSSVLRMIASSVADLRLRGLLASLLLFAPTSLLLGMLSPYLVRLSNESVTTTGRSVASLSACNAVGGISGTFCTGFVFFAAMGTREILVLLAFFLLAVSWLVVPRRLVWQRVGLTLLTIIFAIIGLVRDVSAAKIIDEIETPTSHYQVIEAEYNGRPSRMLVTGPVAAQSGIPLDGSGDLLFYYASQVAGIIKAAPHKDSVLFLGGGAFTLPQYAAVHYPDTRVDVVEIDPKLTDIAKTYFEYRDRPNLRVINDDARTFLGNTKTRYDVVMVDVYNDTAVPFSLTTKEYAAQLKRVLNPGGIVIINVIGATNQQCLPFVSSLDATYRSVFSQRKVYPTHSMSMSTLQNIEFVYSNAELKGLPGAEAKLTTMSYPTDLTDNFAPVEDLWQRCLGGSHN